MTLLLDTHVVLWWRTNSRRLGRAAREAISGSEIVLVSAVSGWEVAIKQGIGKLRLGESFASIVAACDFEELALAQRHAERLRELPHHHGDPFDRMLIAQALVEGVPLVTHDRRFAPYGVSIVWV